MDYHDYMKAIGSYSYPMSGPVVSKVSSSSSFPEERYNQDSKELQWKFKSDNIRIRDNYTCRLCGAKDMPLEVHHIRYISGREIWDYEDGDLVSLCKDCHEGIHCREASFNLKEGEFAYHRKLKGVGFVEEVKDESIVLDVCWNENEHNICLKPEAKRTEVRPATEEEIDEFWEKVEKYLDDRTILEYLIDYVDKHLPIEHQINARVAQPLQKAQEEFVRIEQELTDTYKGLLLVSDDDYALYYDIRHEDSDSPYPIPGFIVTKKKDMVGKTEEFIGISVPYNKLDLAKYRKAKKKDFRFFMDFYGWAIGADWRKDYKRVQRMLKQNRERIGMKIFCWE